MIVINKLNELAERVNSSIVLKQSVWDKRSEGYWGKFWSAFNALKDAQYAINEWKLSTSPQRLEMYGVLQALIVQQDALRHLQEAMAILPINIKNDYPELFEIRVCRNQLVGHPSQTTLSRNSSYLDGTITHTTVGYGKNSKIIEYVISSSMKSERKTLVLDDIIIKQEDVMCSEIEALVTEVESKEIMHKSSFSSGALEGILRTADYLATKAFSSEHEPSYALSSIETLASMYSSFKAEICKMYKVENINDSISVSGLVYEIGKIDKLLPRVTEMLSDRKNIDDFDLDVYAEVLTISVRLLQEMAREIDKEFNTQTT